MYYNKLFIAATLVAGLFVFTSCSTQRRALPKTEMPTAVNTINSVGLSELNLKHGTDYTILNTVTAEATVLYSIQRKGKQITITEENGEFKVLWKYDEENGEMYIADYEGIARYGFLSNDYGRVYSGVPAPEYIVRNLAIYRLINQAKVRGGDGVIEPVISTNVEDRGKDIVFKTTVSAKLIKLTTDAK